MTRYWEPRPNRIESDSGFAIEVLGRAGMRYFDSGKSIFLDSEVRNSPENAMALWASSVNIWESEAGAEPVTENERTVILARLREAFEALGYTLHVIGT